MAAETGDDLARLSAAAEDHTEVADGSGVEIVVGPVVAFLDADAGFHALAVGLGLGHHLCGRVDLLDVDPGDLGGHVGLGLFLCEQPFLVMLG